MAELKPAYLIHGADEVRLDAWRARLRIRARDEGDSTTLEIMRDERVSGDQVAAEMCSLTLAVGRRYVLADGVERWKAADVKTVAAGLAALPPDTVVVLIAAGDAPAGLAKAVEKVGGEVHECTAPKPSQLVGWTEDRARELGIAIDREAAQILIERVPRDDKRKLRQQQLVRELEKLAVFVGEGGKVDAAAVEALCGPALDARIYELADAVVEGDAEVAVRIAEELRARGEDMMYILFGLLRQLRQAQKAAAMIAAGKSVKELQSALRVPTFIARQIAARARSADPERLERALDLLAELDWAIRGAGDLDADSALTRMLADRGEKAAA